MNNKAKNHTLWVERYRPDTIEGFIGNDHIVNKVKQFIEEKSIPNLLFYATPGSGKTTLGKIIVNSIPCDYIYINASDENNVDTVRVKIKNFASTSGFNGIKIVFLDEFDKMTVAAQDILRNLTETYSENTRFICTCNYLEKVTLAMQSRFQKYKIVAPVKIEVIKKLIYILKKEGVKVDTKNKEQMKFLKSIVDKNFPDIRQCIQLIQQNTIGDELVLDEGALTEAGYANKIVTIFQSKPASNQDVFTELKQILADSQLTSFDDLFTELYKNVQTISHGKDPYVIQLIAEYQYQSNFVVDKEISTMAMLLRILQTINTK